LKSLPTIARHFCCKESPHLAASKGLGFRSGDLNRPPLVLDATG
jgi:hypothetical protein